MVELQARNSKVNSLSVDEPMFFQAFRGERKAPRVLKRFNDLSDVTFSDSGATSTRVIVQNGPFGRPALKLTITAGGGGGFTEVRLANTNIANFDDHVVWRFSLENYTRVSQIVGFIGNDSAYTKLNRQTLGVWNNNFHLCSGPGVLVLGPRGPNSVAAGPTFVFGTDPLQATKIQVNVPANEVAVVYVDSCEVPARQRPIVAITFDDNHISMQDAFEVLKRYGLKATFGINTTGLGGALTLSNAQIQAMSQYGMNISCHNQNNNKMRQIYSGGVINGTGSPLTLAAYLAEYRASQLVLEALGVPSEDFLYHPWVQGGFDGASMHAFKSAGVHLARSIQGQFGSGADGFGSHAIYGSGLSNNTMHLPWVSMGNTITLAQFKRSILDCVRYGTLLIPGFHVLAATATDSVTWALSDFDAICAMLKELQDGGAIDVMTMKELSAYLDSVRMLDSNPNGFVYDADSRQIGMLDVNFNTAGDQTIVLPADGRAYNITDLVISECSVSLTTAVGGFYPSTAKGGTPVVAAAQTYTALTGTSTQVFKPTIASAGPVTGNLYLNLTTLQGGSAPAKVFAFGTPAT